MYNETKAEGFLSVFAVALLTEGVDRNRTQQLATYAPPKQVEVTKHLGDEGVDATDKVVTVSLTQADTLLLGSLSPDEDQQVEVQIRGRTEDGRAFASNIMTAPLSRILKDGVI